MIGINDLAEELGFKINTFRYWLKRNEDDYNSGIYNFKLSSLQKKIGYKLQHCNKNKPQSKKIYYKHVIEDKEKFIEEFDNYLKFIKEGKQKNKLYRSLNWTRAAFECYFANGNCEKCFNNYICRKFSDKKTEPPMKKTVRKLLDKIGKPYFNEDYFYL